MTKGRDRGAFVSSALLDPGPDEPPVKPPISLDPDVKVVLPDGSERRLIDYLLPSALLMTAALLVMISMFLPYWSMTMNAPQSPRIGRR